MVVDLDGTLLVGDVLWESLSSLAAQKSRLLLMIPAWLLGGKSGFKRKLAEAVSLDPAGLLFRPELLEYIRGEREAGRKAYLATATDVLAARAIAGHLKLFDGVLGSQPGSNLRGEAKLRAISGLLEGEEFEYIGDSFADAPIFEKAARRVLVCPSPALLRSVAAKRPVEGVLPAPRRSIRVWLQQLRVRQWAKNLLLALPPMLAHKVPDAELSIRILAALTGFSLAASSVYIMNDFLDLSKDRRNPEKRARPLASGAVGVPEALLAAAALCAAAFSISRLLLPPMFSWGLGVYLAANVLYSLDLKRRLLIDVILLASFYMLRLFLGGIATDTPVSRWLLVFGLFFFQSLAFVKRYVESRIHHEEDPRNFGGRGYWASDFQILLVVGPVSGYISLLVLSLYVNDNSTRVLYPSPDFLWIICVALMYWLTRIWFLANRKQLPQDPVLFAFSDWRSYVVGAISAAAVVAASRG
jgi:4-hydroxybenzoate polyprenyltransferase/phosphoserine phosphatase